MVDILHLHQIKLVLSFFCPDRSGTAGALTLVGVAKLSTLGYCSCSAPVGSPGVAPELTALLLSVNIDATLS